MEDDKSKSPGADESGKKSSGDKPGSGGQNREGTFTDDADKHGDRDGQGGGEDGGGQM